MFALSKDLQKIFSQVDAFVREEIEPLEPAFIAKGFNAVWPQIQAKREMVRKQGWWLPQVPQKYGGMGLNVFEHGHLSAILGRSLLGHVAFNCQAPDAGNMEILIEYGTDAQKEAFLQPLLDGKIRSCFSMTEPNNAGSNPTLLSTQAVKDGDDYLINGHKWFTTAADGATFAIVMAVTDPTAGKYQQASQIIVPTDTDGFQLVRNISVMGEPGDGHASHAEILYEDVRVPQANLLGEEGMGFVIAQQRLGPGRIHHCMRWIGICERAFDMMCTYAVRREVAPGRTLADQQTIQNWVAESRAEINAARLMVLQAAEAIDEHGSHGAREEISLIKFYVAGVLGRVLDRAIQTHGALGMTDDTPLAYWYRHERAARIYDGPDEVHKRSVSRKILQRYKGL